METVTNCVFFVFSKADKFKTSMSRVPYDKLLTNLASSSRTFMLLTGWEVCIGKNCDRGLENAARGRRPGVAFSSPRAQFFSIRTDRPITCLSFFFCGRLVFKWVCLRNFVIESAYAPLASVASVPVRSERNSGRSY